MKPQEFFGKFIWENLKWSVSVSLTLMFDEFDAENLLDVTFVF